MTAAPRVALVTGAGRNIGRAVAVALARRGTAVALSTRHNEGDLADALDEVRAHGVPATGLVADVSDRDAVQRMVAEATEALGEVTVLVNTVGLRPRQAFLDVTYEQWRGVLATNLESLFHCAQATIPAMRRQGWGRIIGFSGDQAHHGRKSGGHVSASKLGIVGLTRSLAREFAAEGITANTVVPGPIDTVGPDEPAPRAEDADRLTPSDRAPVGRLGRPGEVAALCAYLASDEAAFVTGQTLHINGGTSVA